MGPRNCQTQGGGGLAFHIVEHGPCGLHDLRQEVRSRVLGHLWLACLQRTQHGLSSCGASVMVAGMFLIYN